MEEKSDKRILSPIPIEGEKEKEKLNIRPQKLDEFIGQNDLKASLNMMISSAKKRNDILDHILLSGPPGLGKTTIASIISREMGTDIKSTSGPVLEKPIEIASILRKLDTGDVLFIDEIHRMNKIVEEILYPAMEDFSIDIIIGEGSSTKSIKIKLKKFTLVGATTKAGLLSAPLRDRFGFVTRFNLYEVIDLVKIVERSATILGIKMTVDGSLEIANRSRGTPRIANRLLSRTRDFAVVNGYESVTKDVADGAMTLLGIDKLGLDDVDRTLLHILINDYNKGPAGVKALAASIGEEVRTIEEMYEPFLLHIGFLKRTERGRMATAKAKKHIDKVKNKFRMLR